MMDGFNAKRVPPAIRKVILVEKLFSLSKLKASQLNLAKSLAEQDATRVIDPIVLAMNGELIKVLIAPAHRNLKNVVQI